MALRPWITPPIMRKPCQYSPQLTPFLFASLPAITFQDPMALQTPLSMPLLGSLMSKLLVFGIFAIPPHITSSTYALPLSNIFAKAKAFEQGLLCGC